MAASASEIRRLRRIVVEPTETTYLDADIAAAIERHPMIDASGYAPDHVDWTPTYDVNGAAADLWEEKAGALVASYDFQADGAAYSRSQMYDQAMRHARKYRSMSAAEGVPLHVTFEEVESWQQ